MAKVAVFGATGFVGRAVAEAISASGDLVTSLPAKRLRVEPSRVVELADALAVTAAGDAAARRTGTSPAPGSDTAFGRVLEAGLVEDGLVDEVARSLNGHDVVVNAAGLPDATAPATPELFGANALWPLVLGLACERAGVTRLVQVSTAAVQGRIRVLDDSPRYAPVSPYAETKALGERLLTCLAGTGRLQVTLFRPPSVHGPGRDLTRAFARWCDRFPLVVSGRGDQPVPVALIGNVAAALVALVAADDPPLIVSHPTEGHTVRSLYESFAPGRRIWSLPPGMVRAVLRTLEPVGRVFPPAAAASRRPELLLLGQAQARSWLEGQRFVLPLGRAEWTELARRSRAL
ncbi:NAD-dependent epimerase/dehydratase family protein [Pseudofrankia inefficax]|uniref:NAD-dependent epimerase/dehydratase n=1 Tax=Pseudofrankia inefficax (strain DSM 45817 / CECT 9037 / DDB 130130 / EuI1c) TaxID=298654 RepID=E3IZ11_PSEI1|nr:NAD-dependent epimerase/dehydratase family protein [Pseudofrankia inefficax]ADP80294.1 NAD-dependent epimerase/dehydratase [Pseudofrankia inefficax]